MARSDPDIDEDALEPLSTALQKLGGLSRTWFNEHKSDPAFFKWSKIGSRVMVNTASRRKYAEQRIGNPAKPGRPRKAAAD